MSRLFHGKDIVRRLASSLAAVQPGARTGPRDADGIAAAAALGIAGVGFAGFAFSQVRCDEYTPPAKLGSSFKSVGYEQLAWAVQRMSAVEVKEVLSADPHAATLMDSDGNSLFHHLAANAVIAEKKPNQAKEILTCLLDAKGFQTVDAKNHDGLRADAVAQAAKPGGVVAKLLEKRSVEWVEPSRQEKPLALLAELTPFQADWVNIVKDEQRRSWGGVLRGAIPEFQLRRWMDTLINHGPWMRPKDTPRSTIWFVDADYQDCPYRYSGLCYPPTVFPPYMHELRETVCQACGIPPGEYPNCCNVNIYTDHRSEVGWHADDEVYFQGLAGDTRILSFSLGAARDFSWRLQGTTETIGTASLGDGDIMTMEGLFQRHYKHAVPPSDIPTGTRLNLTFRWIKTKHHAEDAGTVGNKLANIS